MYFLTQNSEQKSIQIGREMEIFTIRVKTWLDKEKEFSIGTRKINGKSSG